MLETGLAQLRFATSILFGLPFNPNSLERLVDGLLETQNEFGSFSFDAAKFVNGPELDNETRLDFQLRAFRRQAILGARETRYYHRVFDSISLDPRKITYQDIRNIPLTNKKSLQDKIDDFINFKSKPTNLAVTTGTTGNPTSVWFSRREMQSFFLLTTIGLLLDGSIQESDIVQVTTSSRAPLANSCFTEGCTRLGAAVYQTGILKPEIILKQLTSIRNLPGKKSKVSVLSTYPSFLGILIEFARKHGYHPDNFGIERIMLGGEITTQGLKTRAQEIFGQVSFSEGYGMTEPWPLGGTLCEQGHLHFEPSQGLVEVLNLEEDEPVHSGEFGRLVLTPFMPFRETTVLIRYDTEDIVQLLPGPFTCSLSHQQATSNILGKLRLSVKTKSGWVFPRSILEILESDESVSLPARFGIYAFKEGVYVEVFAANGEQVHKRISQKIIKTGISLAGLKILDDPMGIKSPYPWRGDLTESSFETRSPAAAVQED